MDKSYFDKDKFQAKINKLREQADCPIWLINALEELGEQANKFPVEEDEHRFTVEYIYPH